MLTTVTAVRNTPAVNGRPPSAPRAPYSRAELLAAVAQLNEIDCAPTELPDVCAEVTKILARSSNAPVALAPTDVKALRMVTSVLRQLQTHSSVSAPVKSFVRALQVWLLKIAVIDPSVAIARDHPAWDFLARVVDAGNGWAGHDAALRSDAGYTTVSRVVAVVASSAVDDLTAVMTGIAQLDDVLSARRQQAQRDLLRVGAARKGVHELLAGTLATTSAPHCVTEFLKSPWRKVLCTVAERDGTDSSAWKAAASVVENLLWSLTEKTDDAARREFRKIVPTLVAAIEEGLALIMHPHEETRAFLAELEQLHLQTLRGKGVCMRAASAASRAVFERFGSAISVEEVTLESGNPGAVHLSAQGGSDERQPHYQCEQLPVGTWIEWRDGQQTSWRGQLAWMDGFFREATFIDRDGAVAADLKFEELAFALRNGKARLLDGGNIVAELLNTKID